MKGWKRLLAIEPLLEQVRPPEVPSGERRPTCLARQLQALLHTRHTHGANTLPFVAVVEGCSASAMRCRTTSQVDCACFCGPSA